MREWLRRLDFFLHRSKYESDLAEEMAHHLSMLQTDRGMGAGAHRQFGNVTSLKEESRSMWTFGWLEQLGQDIRYAVRAMAANPLFTATAALSLALGIGANTAIYSFMDAILMRSLPVQSPQQLVVLKWRSTKRPAVVRGLNGTNYGSKQYPYYTPNFPYAAFEKWRGANDLYSSLFAYTYVQNFNTIVAGEAASLAGGFVSGNYFGGLGVPPAYGRLLTDDDDRSGALPTMAISYAWWQHRFNGEANAIGKSVSLNGIPFTIVGVTAPGFAGVDPQNSPLFFLPIHQLPALSPTPSREERNRFFDKNFYWIEMMARLRPGVSLERAEAAMRAQFSSFAASTAATPKEAAVLPDLFLDPGGTGLEGLRRQYAKPLYVLMTMVGLILAIACANLANLLLSRAAARRREIAVRLSLGAGRWRIVRQMLTESVLLAIAGGALGLLVAIAGIRMITWLIANGREDFTLHATIDWPVLGFTFGLSIIAGLIFGLAPAIQSTKLDFTPALKESRTQGSGAIGHGLRPRLGHLLIVTQIAVSMLLVVAAGLFVRTLLNLHSIDVGFNRDNILLVSLNGRSAGYKDDRLARFYGELLEKFRQLPGVRGATASNFPLVARYVNDDGVLIPGRTPQKGDDTDELNVDPDFFETMKIPILLGRGFQPGDLASPRVAVVNEQFAKKYFPGESPVGRQFSLGEATNPLIEIVGVAKNAHYNSFQEKPTEVTYVPYTQTVADLRGLFFELRTSGDPTALAATVRRIVHEANRDVAITEITTQQARMEQTISQQRTFADLGSAFAGLALLIACVGLYGAMAYTVARRTGEIGIRMALGAQRKKIIWMVQREVLVLTALGLALGGVAAHFLTELVESFLFETKPNDPWAVTAAVAILLLSGMAAGYAPAWRASRIDPVVALRNE